MTPRENSILAALPRGDYERLLPDLNFVIMPLGEVVAEADHPTEYLYFPATSIVSHLSLTRSGASTEIAVTGREGLVGVTLFMGGDSTNSRAVVQGAGYGYRLRADRARDEFERGGPLQLLALRFTQALITQMSQTAVCNRHHTLDQQTCRWLLMCTDRLGEDQLKMTQGLIANMLGVRRESVYEIAGKLQASGLIRYSRGQISILDRSQLKERTCECYRVIQDEYDRLLLSPARVLKPGSRE